MSEISGVGGGGDFGGYDAGGVTEAVDTSSLGGADNVSKVAATTEPSEGNKAPDFNDSPTAAAEKEVFNTADQKKADLQARADKVEEEAKTRRTEALRMDAASEAKLAKLNPELADRIRRTAADLAKQGIDVRVVSGLRTFAEQNALYAQGRTAPGNKVTNVTGGGSFHNYGLATDLAPLKNGKIDWKAPQSTWNAMGAAGKRNGLEWGGDWKKFVDRPHFQMTGGVKSASSFRGLYEKEGLQGVWNKVNGNTPPLRDNGIPREIPQIKGPREDGAETRPQPNKGLPLAGDRLPGERPIQPGFKPITEHMERGYRSPQIKNLQDALVARGYMKREEIGGGYGRFGPKTEAAIRNFQRDNDLKVDGIVGPETRRAMMQKGGAPAMAAAPAAGIRTETGTTTASAAGINDILKGTNLAGKGQLIADLSKKYNVPAEVALAMFRKEAGFAKAGTLAAANNNPGNIKFAGQAGATRGEGGFARWNSMDQGIEGYFKLLDRGYRGFINNKDWAGLVNKYAPPIENDSRRYTNEITNWMTGYRKRIGG